MQEDYTISEAIDELRNHDVDITNKWLHALIRDGRITATKHRGRLLVTHEELMKYVESRKTATDGPRRVNIEGMPLRGRPRGTGHKLGKRKKK